MGDVIDGVTIVEIGDAKVNSQGQIACMVYGSRQKNGPASGYAFVDNHLVFEDPGGMFDFEFGNSGTPYLISFRHTYTTDGKNWSPDGAPLPPDIVNSLTFAVDASDPRHVHAGRASSYVYIPVGHAWHPFEMPTRLPGQASPTPSGPIVTSPMSTLQTQYGFSDSPTIGAGKLFFAPAGLPSDAYGGNTTVDAYYNADEEPVVIVADSRGKGDPKWSGSEGAVGSGVIWGPQGLVACYLTSTGQITKGFSTKNSVWPFIPYDPIINRQGQILFQTPVSDNPAAYGLFKFVVASPDNGPAPEPDICPFCERIAAQYDAQPDKKESIRLAYTLLGALSQLNKYREAYLKNPTYINLFPTAYYNTTLIELRNISEGKYKYPIEKMEQMITFFDAYMVNRERYLTGNAEPQWKLYYQSVAEADKTVSIVTDNGSDNDFASETQNVLASGIEAHVKYDFPRALRYSYDHRFHQDLSKMPSNYNEVLYQDFQGTEETLRESEQRTKADIGSALWSYGRYEKWSKLQIEPIVAFVFKKIGYNLFENYNNIIALRNKAWKEAFDGTALLPDEQSQPLTNHSVLERQGHTMCDNLPPLLKNVVNHS